MSDAAESSEEEQEVFFQAQGHVGRASSLKLKLYTGVGQSLRSWWDVAVERIELLDVPVAKQVLSIAAHLSGPALALYQRTKRTRQAAGEPVLNMDTLHRALQATFSHADGQQRVRARLHHHRQGQDSVSTYYARFVQMESELDDISQAERLSLFMEGLNATMRRDLYRYGAATEAATQVEDILARALALESVSTVSVETPTKLQGRNGYQGPQPTAPEHGHGSAKFKGNCHTCGKPGHKSSVCRSGPPKAAHGGSQHPTTQVGSHPTQSLSRPHTPGATCSWCGKTGHVEAQCFSKRDGKPRKAQAGSQPSAALTILTATAPKGIYLDLWIMGNNIKCLVDTGAGCSVMSPGMASELKLPTAMRKGTEVFVGGSNKPLLVDLFTHAIPITVDTGAVQLSTSHDFMVLECGRENVLLGLDFLAKVGCAIDLRTRQLTFNCPITANPFSDHGAEKGEDPSPLNTDEILALETTVMAIVTSPATDVESAATEIEDIISTLSENVITAKIPHEIASLLEEYRDICPQSVTQLREAKIEPFEVVTTTERPIYCPPYRASEMERRVIAEQVKDLLVAGIIRLSTSPWSAPVLLVPKPGNTQSFRMCIDYRRLNAITISDASPIPLIRDILDSLGNLEYVSELDLLSGYYQMGLASGSIAKLAFSTPDGHYEFVRMPMGPRNGPAAFNRAMVAALANMSGVAVYFDNIIIKTSNGGITAHINLVRKVFDRLRQLSISLNVNKSKILKDNITLLGYRVSRQGIQVDEEKIAPLITRPAPQNVKELQVFLGMANYYHTLVQGYANIAQPLYQLLKQSSAWNWSASCQNAYQELLRALTTTPVLRIPQLDQPFTIHCDASGVAIGAVLSQLDEMGKEHPCMYLSRLLKGAEVHYGISELECLAIVWAISKLRHYIFGQRFTVVTDHSALTWLLNVKDPHGRLARWGLYLQTFDFKIIYRRGVDHGNVDALSRPPQSNIFRIVTRAMSRQVEPTPSLPHNQPEPGSTTSATMGNSDTPVEPIQPTLSHELDAHTLPDQEVSANLAVTEPGNVRDPWEDINLLIFLQTGKHRSGISNRAIQKVDRKAKEYHWDSVTRQLQHLTTSTHGASIIRVVPAPSERATIVDRAHALGHFATQSTYDRLSANYYWPGMFKNVKETVETCIPCLRTKLAPTVHHPARAMEISTLFDTVAMDLVLGFPEVDGFVGIITFIDCFSQYPLAYPIRSKTAVETARHLMGWIALFGPPKTLLSDNGTEFVNATVAALAELTGVERLVTSPYHPNTNGRVERFNGTFVAALRAHASANPTTWPLWIDYVLLAYRTRIHTSTNQAPFALVFGKECQQFTSWGDNTEVTQKEDAHITLALRADEIRRLCEVNEETATLLQERQSIQKQQQDAREARIDLQALEIGAKVWVLMGQRPGKLTPRYTGPYNIVEATEGGNYILATQKGKRLLRSYPRDKLKLQKTDSVIDGETTFRVDEVLDQRPSTNGAGVDYLVKWSGYPVSEATWEAESSFIDLGPIDDYWRQQDAKVTVTNNQSE